MNFDANFINYIFTDPRAQAIFLLLAIWNLIWKGFALWKAAHNDQRNWFIAILIINSFGILEIIYLFYLSKPRKIDKPSV